MPHPQLRQKTMLQVAYRYTCGAELRSQGERFSAITFSRSATASAKGVPAALQHFLQFWQTGITSLPVRYTESWKGRPQPHEGHQGIYKQRTRNKNRLSI